MKKLIQILTVALAICVFATDGFGAQVLLRRSYPIGDAAEIE